MLTKDQNLSKVYKNNKYNRHYMSFTRITQLTEHYATFHFMLVKALFYHMPDRLGREVTQVQQTKWDAKCVKNR